MKIFKIFYIIIISIQLFLFGLQKPVQVFMAGDSTMAEKPMTKKVTDSISGIVGEENFLEKGWGMFLGEYFNDDVIIRNYAQNGRSTRTFIEQGWWNKIISEMENGDYVIIQFAHNDGAIDKPDRYTSPEDYTKNLIQMVDEVRAKKGYPILCTSIMRRKFDKNGKLIDTHGVYPEITREIAKLKKVPLVDMQKMTTQWLENEGVEKSKKFFHKISADGSSRLFPKGLDDNTHLNEQGARIVAGMFANDIRKQKVGKLYKKLRKVTQ